MRSTNMNDAGKAAILSRIAGDGVPDTLDLWPSVRQVMRQRHGRDRTRWAVAGLGSAALIALLVAATLPLWSGAETVSAETLLDRAESAPATTYHMLMVRQTPAKSDETITSEVWFGGSDRQRSLQQVHDASGTLVTTSEVVFNGAQAWIATSLAGHTLVIHTTGTDWTRPADDPAAISNLTDLLAKYNKDKQCTTAQLQGEGTVAGRTSYIVELAPKPGTCGSGIAVGEYTIGQMRAGTPEDRSAQSIHMQVWVDKQTFLPLKTEVRDAAGVLLDRSEVTSVQYGGSMPDAMFSYTPPTGAQVSTFNGGSGADVKRALFSNQDPPNKSATSSR
jgi:outer membrane lipoprotein-sorting protein